MNDNPILGQLVLGYCPMIDRQRAITATRLTVFPLRPDATPDAAALFDLVAQAWPVEGQHKVVLNITSETLLHAAMLGAPPANVMLEVPAFMAGDAGKKSMLHALNKKKFA